MRRRHRFALTFALLLIGVTLVSLLYHRLHEGADPWAGDPFAGREIRCALNIGRFDDSTRALVTGYNYVLLKAFAEEIGSTATFIPVRDKTADWADSLRAGTLDILVLPCRRDAGLPEGTMASRPIDSLSVWVVREADLHGLKDINAWLKKYAASPLHDKLKRSYIQTIFDPVRLARDGRTRRELSPYDSLFKAYAPRLGWDWRMLAALSFKESLFRIDAHSHRNAFGLMQMGEATAEKYGLQDPLEPEDNIRTGVRYLSFLQRVFSKRLPEGASDEVTKFVLAAYNGGEGRLLDCIDMARELQVYDSTWASLQGLPEQILQAGMAADSLDLRKYRLDQIAGYVDDVLDTYSAFRAICP